MNHPVIVPSARRYRRTVLALVACLAAALLLTAASVAQSGPFKVGVLPFVDNTGSNAGDVATSVSRAVQAEMIHATPLVGSVLTLDDGLSPASVDGAKAVEIGRAKNVDVVVVGTVLEATSEQSSGSSHLPSVGGISLGGLKQSVKATVTLQADLYSTTTGEKLDSIRQSGTANQSKLGTSINTGLGGIDTGGNFDNSAMGKAFHTAVSQLVAKINADQAQMAHYVAGAAPATQTAAPAAAAQAQSAPAPAAPPVALTAYQNYDFTPGDKIIFSDDFTDTQDGEFPERWSLVSGQAVVNANNGKPAFYLTDGNYVKVSPRIKGDSYLADTYTIEFDWIEPAGTYGLNVFFKGANGDAQLSLDAGGVEYDGLEKKLSAELPVSLRGDDFHNAFHHVAIAVKGMQMKVYVDQFRALVVPDDGGSFKSVQLGGIGSAEHPLIFTNVRLASGGGMNMIGQKFTDAKIVTHGITFDVDKATLKPESMGTLNQIKRILTQNPDLHFEVDGHTDNTGTAAHNLTLSQQRAEAVKAQLVSMGIDAGRLTTKGFGDTKPIADNGSPDGRANNRRVEFVKTN